MNKVDARIKAAKKRDRGILRTGNLFRAVKLNENVCLNILYALISSSVIAELMENYLQNKLLATAVLTLIIAVIKQLTEAKPYPQAFKSTERFIGLCSNPHEQNSENDTSVNLSGLIKRKKEIKIIYKYINNAFQVYKETNNTQPMRGVCLVGASGCGKSILLDMLEHKKKLLKTCDIKRFESEYFNDKAFKNKVNAFCDKGLKKNRVAIFDQFEQVLKPNSPYQREILSAVNKMAKEGIFIIFALREEYFMLFMELFSMRQMLAVKDENSIQTLDSPSFVKMVSTEKKSKKGKKQKETSPSNMDVVMLESKYNMSPSSTIQTTMQDLCEGAEIKDYEKIKDRPLIEQQIILNMMDNSDEQPSDTKIAYTNRDFQKLMKNYYDVQLCSTEAYFLACQIVYLLSKARLDNTDIRYEWLNGSLCMTSEEANTKLKPCLKKLCELNLIKTTDGGSKYEIAHDFIAQTFDTYANDALSPEIRVALEDGLAACRSDTAKTSTKVYAKKQAHDRWIMVVWIFSFVAVLGRYTIGLLNGIEDLPQFIQMFIATFNIPTQQLNSVLITCGDVSLAVVIMAIASLFYVFIFYRNMTQYYGIVFDRKYDSSNTHSYSRRYVVAAAYVASMICGTMAVYLGSIWLFWLGLGNTINGLSCMFIASDKTVVANGQKSFYSYGGKTVICGVLLMVGSYSVSLMESVSFGFDVKIMIQLIVMGTLLFYSYVHHIDQRYFYTHVEALLNARHSAAEMSESNTRHSAAAM